MSDQPQHPRSREDSEGWKAYWKAQGMPWRSGPEIDEERQRYLAERRAVKPNIEKGIYPFRDERGGIALKRADVEWLLATHESRGVRGPVEWSSETQRTRSGLDLRGADLCEVNLSGLPLAGVVGAVSFLSGTAASREMGAIHLERAILSRTHLEGAQLRDAHLEGASIDEAHLENADLSVVHLEKAKLSETTLRAANLGGVHWGADAGAVAHLEDAILHKAYLQDADLRGAHLEGANNSGAHLEGAKVMRAHLEGASLTTAHLEGADLSGAHLDGADLNRANFSDQTNLESVSLSSKRYGAAKLGDVRWGGTDLTVVDWQRVKRLGDEVSYRNLAREIKQWSSPNEKQRRLSRYLSGAVLFLLVWLDPKGRRDVARAYRRLAVALREQGMTEDADRFLYRAQMQKHKILFLQILVDWRKPWLFPINIGRWGASLSLDLLAGYGYRPGRSVLWYLVVIFGFTYAYYQSTRGLLTFGLHPSAFQPLQWYEALVLSISSFHGRGFFQPVQSLGDPVAILAAAEAVIGLVIEITFIATFTQRFFAR